MKNLDEQSFDQCLLKILFFFFDLHESSKKKMKMKNAKTKEF